MIHLKRSKIRKDIKKIRKESKSKGVNYSVREIEKYYVNNKYDEEELLYRINQLEVDFLFENNVFSGIIGGLIGIILGTTETFTIPIKAFITQSKKHEKTFMLIVAGFIFIIGMIVLALVLGGIVSLLMFLIKKSYTLIRKESIYEEYLKKKEIEIIEEILEKKNKRIKRKRRKNYKYSSGNFKRRA